MVVILVMILMLGVCVLIYVINLFNVFFGCCCNVVFNVMILYWFFISLLIFFDVVVMKIFE